MSEFNKSPRSNRDPHLYLVLEFWLAWLTSLHSCLSTCLLDSPACLVTLSLDTVEDVMVGEVDELEADVR